MFELNKLLVTLGIIVGTSNTNIDMNFYRQKLSTEITNEQKYVSELKTVDYQKMWTEVSVDNKDKKTVESSKLHEREIMAKGRLKETRQKIKVLKTIIEKDSLDRIIPTEVNL